MNSTRRESVESLLQRLAQHRKNFEVHPSRELFGLSEVSSALAEIPPATKKIIRSAKC